MLVVAKENSKKLTYLLFIMSRLRGMSKKVRGCIMDKIVVVFICLFQHIFTKLSMLFTTFWDSPRI